MYFKNTCTCVEYLVDDDVSPLLYSEYIYELQVGQTDLSEHLEIYIHQRLECTSLLLNKLNEKKNKNKKK